jgi:hypothetical protein
MSIEDEEFKIWDFRKNAAEAAKKAGISYEKFIEKIILATKARRH